MKLLFVFFFLSTLSAGAQTNDKPVKLVHYVLDSFANGIVKLRSGKVYTQLLNYNLLTKEMIFESQPGKYLAIAQPEDVDTVVINERKFIPVNNAFYEWLGGTTYPLFVEFAGTIKEQGAQTGFGTTNTSAATSVKSILKDGGAYALKLPDEFQVISRHSFYIRKNEQYHKANNEQQIIRLFPEKKLIIKDWIKNHNTDFSRQNEMIILMQQIQ